MGDQYKFYRLQSPTLEDLYELTAKIHTKVLSLIEKLDVESDQTEFDQDLLGEISKVSIQQKLKGLV